MSDDDGPTVEVSKWTREEKLEKIRNMVKNWVPYDPRFPNTNQTRNCQQNYWDYHRCLRAKNGDEEYCAWYKNAYKRLCPVEWYEHYDEQVEKGIFPPLVRDELKNRPKHH